MKINPQAFEWDFDGSCAPGKSGNRWNETFSVGVFQWLPRASGKGLKRGKVVWRVSGRTTNPQEVYSKAEAYISRVCKA